MAVAQAGMTLGRGVVLVGIGLVGSRIPKVAEILADFQESLREKGANTAESGSAAGNVTNDVLGYEIDNLTRVVRQMCYNNNNAVIHVETGSGGAGSALIVPAVVVGAVGYCYMWWNGISFSSLMYVTKRNMATAVASMTKHLEQVQSSLAAAKKHLSQRIQRVDDKLEQQKKISGQIKDQVTGVRIIIRSIGSDMDKIKNTAIALVQKMDSIEAKQNYSHTAVKFLCKFIEQGVQKLPEHVEGSQQTARRIGYSSELKGLGLLALDSASPTAQTSEPYGTNNASVNGISAARLIL